MKRFFILIIVATAWLTSLFAVTEQEARNYFQRCILSLDPIEGCYSVEYRGSGESANASFVSGSAWWSAFAETTLKKDVYIVKMNENRDGKFLICLGDTKKENWQYYYVLERIGTTNAYKFLTFNKDNNIIQSCHVYMENNFRFVVNYNKKDASGYVSALGGGGHVDGYEFQLSFVKSFPTAEMYASAKREEIKENYAYNSGTAFALNDGYFATNYHVYEGKKYAIAKGLNNNTYRAFYIAGDEANDIAIFQIRDNNFTGFDNIPYSISSSTADIGEEVWTLGFPQTNLLGDEIKYTKGEISALSGSSSDGNSLKTNDIRLYQITTPITHGNSGGPLFDEIGQLIGITSYGWKDMDNINYAIKSHLLIALLESAGLRNVMPSGNQLKGEKQKDQIKKVKPFIFQVVCYDNKELENEFFKASIAEEKRENEAKNLIASQATNKDVNMSCDTIITIDGRKVLCEITNVTSSAIMYKDILTSDENVQTISKSEIQTIIFANGVRQEYKYTPTPSQPMASQPISQDKERIDPIYKNGKTYYYNGREMQGLQYELFLKEHCPDAYDQYKSGIRRVKGGSATLGVGAGLLLIGGICYGAGETPAGFGILMAGTAATVAGIPVLCVGIKMKNTAYKTFNDNCHNAYRPDRYINLQVCQNGIGLSFTF